MVRITIDANLPDRLAALHEPAELYSADGRRVGRFLPEAPVVLTVSQAREADLCPYTDEELERFRTEPGEGQSLAEIWKELGRQ